MKTWFVFLLAFCLSTGASAKEGHKHGHVAPHGGTLVEVGEHQFNLEFVRDAEAGTLTAYVLGAHAADFVRVPLKEIALVIGAGGRTERLVLAAQANALSGEVVGDTATFAGQAMWLRSTAEFKGRVPVLEIRGVVFKDLVFTFPVNKEHDED